MEQGLNYRACDAKQNKFSMSHRLVRSNVSLKVGYFLLKETLGKKKEEPGKQRESTSTKLAVTVEDLSLYLTQRTVRRVKEPYFLCQNCIS